ncbi:MAG: penicillin-insensitive murein endopeptidase [Bauldia sp.]
MRWTVATDDSGSRSRTIRAARLLIAALLLPTSGALAAGGGPPAKQLFGKVAGPVPIEARSIGFYSRGCLAGAEPLPVDGAEWQAMRLSRNRHWGMPALVAYVEKLARDARVKEGWSGLLVGDMSQPRGGPMPTGHASHQIGLDVDIWLDPMPGRMLSATEREAIGATSYVRAGTNVELDKSRWTAAHSRLLRLASSYPEVERIFVNPGIKKELCGWAGSDRAWLRKIRPWYNHDDHFHVRLRCPAGLAGCQAQEPTPAGDGCDDNLAWWLSPERYRPPKGPIVPAPELTLSDLPAACAGILAAAPDGVTPADFAVRPPLPRPRPEMN